MQYDDFLMVDDKNALKINKEIQSVKVLENAAQIEVCEIGEYRQKAENVLVKTKTYDDYRNINESHHRLQMLFDKRTILFLCQQSSCTACCFP